MNGGVEADEDDHHRGRDHSQQAGVHHGDEAVHDAPGIPPGGDPPYRSRSRKGAPCSLRERDRAPNS